MPILYCVLHTKIMSHLVLIYLHNKIAVPIYCPRHIPVVPVNMRSTVYSSQIAMESEGDVSPVSDEYVAANSAVAAAVDLSSKFLNC